MALAFLSLGARGPTLPEILEGLKFNLTKTPETEIHQGFQHLLQMLGRPSHQLQLSVGNAMFVQEQLKLLHKFREDARALCASEAFSTDFRGSDTAKKLINDYVRNKTQGKIVEFFKDLDKLTNIVLVNYIFFKGECLDGGSERNPRCFLRLQGYFCPGSDNCVIRQYIKEVAGPSLGSLGTKALPQP